MILPPRARPTPRSINHPLLDRLLLLNNHNENQKPRTTWADEVQLLSRSRRRRGGRLEKMNLRRRVRREFLLVLILLV
jgi:hypothetical protein